ncbi:unnamed protein product, partial [Rotaria magnacalcarata]
EPGDVQDAESVEVVEPTSTQYDQSEEAQDT